MGLIIHWISTHRDLFRIDNLLSKQVPKSSAHITAIRLGLNCQKILFKLFESSHKLTDFCHFVVSFCSRDATGAYLYPRLACLGSFPSFPSIWSNLLNLMVVTFLSPSLGLWMSPGSNVFVLYIGTLCQGCYRVSNEVDTEKKTNCYIHHISFSVMSKVLRRLLCVSGSVCVCVCVCTRKHAHIYSEHKKKFASFFPWCGVRKKTPFSK